MSDPRPPRRRPASLALLVPWLALACGGSGEAPGAPTQRVLHLDPRLADGRSPAEMLAARRELVRSWETTDFRRAAEELAPWTLDGLEPRRARGSRALELHAVGERTARDPARGLLVLGETLEASSFDRIELDLLTSSQVRVDLRWWTQNGSGAEYLAVQVEPRTEVQTVVIAPSGHAGWRDRLTLLQLRFSFAGRPAVELRALRFLASGFEMGSERLGEELAQRPSGDGGLVTLGLEARRSWPSDFGVPLHARALLPRRARLVVGTALPGYEQSRDERVVFAVEARSQGGDWQERARRSLVPAREPGQLGWTDLVADLADLGGQEVELRLCAWSGAGERDGAVEPRVARVLWGAPMVLGELPDDRRPNLVLVTLDTTRVGSLGCYGGSAATPVLDALAQRGIVYEDHWSTCGTTTPAHASILSGLHVTEHGVQNNQSTLPPEIRTLAEVLREGGYHTAAAVSVMHLRAGYSGLGQGFDHFFDPHPDANSDGSWTLAAVEELLDGWRAAGDRPFFLWLHLFDPHAPYGPPQDFVEELLARERRAPPSRDASPATITGRTPYTEPGGFLEGVTSLEYARFLYDAGVSYTDHLVGRLVGALERSGFDARTGIAVTADHGESLGEHDVWFAHAMLFPPVLHVPLILALPGAPAGVRVGARTSAVDLPRTLTGWLGMREEWRGSGQDLLGLARPGAIAGERRVWFVQNNLINLGLRDERWHYFSNTMRAGGERVLHPDCRQHLHDVSDDPDCLTNLRHEHPEQAALHQQQLADWLELTRTGRTLERDLSLEEEALLRAMGYLGDE